MIGARVAVAAVIWAAYALTALLLPQLLVLDDGQAHWQLGLTGGGLALAVAMIIWSLRAVPPGRAASVATRDFPLNVTIAYFLSAMIAAVLTSTAHRGRLGIDVLLPGVLTYVLLLAAIPAVYLTARRIPAGMRMTAGRSIQARGRRQGIQLGIAIAMQLPIILCGLAMVLVEQTSGGQYEQAIEEYHRDRYERLLERTRRVLDDPERVQDMLEVVEPPPGVELFTDGEGRISWVVQDVDRFHARPLALRAAPFTLIAFVIILTMLLGRWIARRTASELRAVEAVIGALHGGVRSEAAGQALNRAVALREMIGLADAVQVAVAGFEARRLALSRAAERRQASEKAKARFLRHLSHELKSPLNSILGFSELLLAEIDGPLTGRQRSQLAAVWRSGERLERYILALLDLARLEEAGRAASQLSLQVTSTGRLAAAIRDQLRPDPLGDSSVEVLTIGEARCRIDLDQTARAVRLAAGLIDDCVARGQLRISIAPAPGGSVDVEIEIIGAEDGIAERLDRVRLLADGRAAEEATEAGASVRLLRSLSQAQHARFSVTFDDRGWPSCRLGLPGA